jgi:hypothetical protein
MAADLSIFERRRKRKIEHDLISCIERGKLFHGSGVSY